MGVLYNYECCDNFGSAIVSAVAYIHEKGYVHGDIKCFNILLNRNGTQVAEKLSKNF